VERLLAEIKINQQMMEVTKKAGQEQMTVKMKTKARINEIPLGRKEGHDGDVVMKDKD
jgi:hypothetical protein